MEVNKELEKFMDKKNKEARGEIIFDAQNEHEDKNTLPPPPKSINQEIPINKRLTNLIIFTRILLNILFIIPIFLSIIFLFGYIFLKFLPALLLFIKKILTLLGEFM